jgi:hypothetical protein
MRLWPYLLLTVAGVAWGFGFPLGKLALTALSAPHLIVLRLGIAGLVSAPYVAASREARRMLRDPWAWVTGLFYGLGFLVQFAGLSMLTVSLAALLIGLMPALIAAASVLWGERVTPRGWAGVLAATLGAGLIALGAGAAGGSLLGVGISVISLLVFLVYIWGGAPDAPVARPPGGACRSASDRRAGRRGYRRPRLRRSARAAGAGDLGRAPGAGAPLHRRGHRRLAGGIGARPHGQRGRVHQPGAPGRGAPRRPHVRRPSDAPPPGRGAPSSWRGASPRS